MPSSGSAYQELGQSKIKDFSNNDSNIQFTDYKKAYNNNNKFINPEKVKYKQYKNIKELKAERSNISHKLSKDDERLINERKRKQEEDEIQRLERIKNQDNKYLDHFDKINKLLVKDY